MLVCVISDATIPRDRFVNYISILLQNRYANGFKTEFMEYLFILYFRTCECCQMLRSMLIFAFTWETVANAYFLFP